MSDRIVLHDMVFEGRHGVLEREQLVAQPFHIDVELELDLSTAGATDDLAATVDYASVFAVCERIVQGESVRLLETLAERIAQALLAGWPIESVVVRARKPDAPINGTLGWAGVEIRRERPVAG